MTRHALTITFNVDDEAIDDASRRATITEELARRLYLEASRQIARLLSERVELQRARRNFDPLADPNVCP